MTLKSLAIIALISSGASFVAPQAFAQNRVSDVPANIPPASFSGRQFVDNNGCVFVRAGFDGNVTWVPRVTRQRDQICGQAPTFRAARAAAAPAPAAEAPVAITVATPPAAEAVAAPAPQPTPAAVRSNTSAAAATAAAAPAQRVVRRVVRPAPQPAAPARVVRAPAPSTPTPVAPTVRATVPQGQGGPTYAMHPCAHGGTATTREINGHSMTVRCAPQAAPHVSVMNGKPSANARVWVPGSVDGQARIIPRHVYEQAVKTGQPIPEGYRLAWDDDRLNPHRALQTVDGYTATQRVWTNTVPREDVNTARQQQIKTPVITGRVTVHTGAKASVSTKSAAPKAVKRKPVVSTRTAPKGGTHYVNVGAFTTKAKADAAAQRLKRAGLPVRYGKGNGMTYVLVGPYGDTNAAKQALKKTHATGYVQAKLR